MRQFTEEEFIRAIYKIYQGTRWQRFKWRLRHFWLYKILRRYPIYDPLTFTGTAEVKESPRSSPSPNTSQPTSSKSKPHQS